MPAAIFSVTRVATNCSCREDYRSDMRESIALSIADLEACLVAIVGLEEGTAR